jgi:hypothetical protein
VDVWHGSLLALDWLQVHSPVSDVSAERITGPLFARVMQLWASAVDEADQVSHWNSVTEHIFKPEPLSEFFESETDTNWEELPINDRLKIADFFRTQQEANT